MDDNYNFKLNNNAFTNNGSFELPTYDISIPKAPIAPIINKNAELEKLIENQTKELQKIHYENKNLNAQLQTANVIIDKQLSELEGLKTSNNSLNEINNTLKLNNQASFKQGLAVGFITSLVMFILTIIATHFGLL